MWKSGYADCLVWSRNITNLVYKEKELQRNIYITDMNRISNAFGCMQRKKTIYIVHRVLANIKPMLYTTRDGFHQTLKILRFSFGRHGFIAISPAPRHQHHSTSKSGLAPPFWIFCHVEASSRDLPYERTLPQPTRR